MEKLKSLQQMIIDSNANTSGSDLGQPKKFSFKSKQTKSAQVIEHEKKEKEERENKEKGKEETDIVNDNFVDDSCTFRNKKDQTIKIGNETESKDVLISNMNGCRVECSVYTTAIRLVNLSNCTVLLAPVAGSVFVENCTDCQFVAACHQVMEN